MSFTHKPGNGALFINTFKEGNQPDYRGDGTVETTCPKCQAPFVVAINMAGWQKFAQGDRDRPFTSLSLKDKLRDEAFKKAGDHYTEYDSPQRPTKGAVRDFTGPDDRSQYNQDIDDDIPF